MATRGAGRATATQAQSRVQGGAGRTRKLRGARTGCSSSPASRGWSATLTCPMRGACDRWVMSRPRAVAPHLDLSLNTYAGLGRPHRAVLTCLTMSGSFRRVLVTITVTRARVRASKSALPAAHLMQGRCVPCRTGWTQGRAREIPAACPCPRPARAGPGGRGQGATLRHLQDLRRSCSNHTAAAATHRHYHPAR